MRILLIIIVFSIITSCNKSDEDKVPDIDFKEFTSFGEFVSKLESLANEPDSKRLTKFLDSLEAHHQIPYVKEDSVAFIYQGNANSISWAGDFNNWNPSTTGYSGVKLESNLWIMKQSFPTDARLDYKLVLNNSQWILDPLNKYIQYSGFGPNSELRMPDWVFPDETKLIEGASRGMLSGNALIASNELNLGYNVQYKVYTPYGYEQLSNLPVIYVTDGHEYADDRLGAMLIVLDNLIHQQRIEPIIAVFIDPRSPENNITNRRMTEYAGNIKFVNFIADELVPVIDSTYKTNPSAEARAIIGTSMGGWNSAYTGVKRSDKFNLIGIHSPAFNTAVIQDFNQSPLLPLKIFMSTGVINDTQVRAREMKAILLSKGYELNYIEVNQGHSWGNWRSLIDEPLIYFFGK
jgi:enterochelin esterase-like enzyme